MSPSASDEFFANEWKAAYEGIYRCNDAIANLHKATMSEAKYKRLVAECKFLRAYFYYWLNALFQGVPIYLEPFVTTECTKTQNTVDEVWQAVLDDLDDCIAEENLPNNTLKENYGRPSKGSAYALRGIVYIWKKDYKKAIADFEQVGKCGYGLWEGEYIDFFKKENERDKEMIFPIQFDAVVGYSDCIQAIFGCRSTLQSVTFIQPNADFVDSYQNADGSPFKWTDIFPDWDKLTPAQREIFFVRDGMNTNMNTDFQNAKKSIIGRVSQAIWDKYYLNEGNEARILTAYSTRDPRLMQTIFAPSTTTLCYANTGGKQSAKTVRWPFLIAGNGDAAGDHWPDARYYCNYTYRKFVVTDDSNLNRIICDEDWPLIRYTNIWLLYAEALNEDGRLGDAISVVNRIRERAHMPLLTNGGSGYNAVMGKEDMRKRIQYEPG